MKQEEVPAHTLIAVLRALELGSLPAGPKVADAVRLLTQLGLLEDDPVSGLRLLRPIDWLEREVIDTHLAAQVTPFRVGVVTATGSTNDDVMQMARNGAPSGSVLAAEMQTAGRGRLGRAWLSMPGAALTFSLLWRFPFGTQRLSALTLAVGVALARALDHLKARGVQLKWPNDVLCDQHKLCGVLVETAGDEQACFAVIGIGINVRHSRALAARLDQPVSDLQQAGVTRSRNEILAALLRHLNEALLLFEREGFAPFRPEWEARHAHRDRMASVVMADESIAEGRVRGVSEDGALLIETAQGVKRIFSGDVRVQPVAHSPT